MQVLWSKMSTDRLSSCDSLQEGCSQVDQRAAQMDSTHGAAKAAIQAKIQAPTYMQNSELYPNIYINIIKLSLFFRLQRKDWLNSKRRSQQTMQ